MKPWTSHAKVVAASSVRSSPKMKISQPRRRSGLAPYHGRLMVMNAKSAPESTGHGVVMPHLVHGGPGRAGGGEELGGVRSLYHYMQRIALQGDPERLEKMLAPALAQS